MSLINAEKLIAHNLVGKVEVRIDGEKVDLSCCVEAKIGEDGHIVFTDNPPQLNDEKDDIIHHTKSGKVECLLIDL